MEAVYHSELDPLEAEGGATAGRSCGADALWLWMNRYARFTAAKHATRQALHLARASRAAAAFNIRVRLRTVVADCLAAAVADGTVCDDVKADDLTDGRANLVLVTMAAPDSAWVRRVLNLLTNGLRPRL